MRYVEIMLEACDDIIQNGLAVVCLSCNQSKGNGIRRSSVERVLIYVYACSDYHIAQFARADIAVDACSAYLALFPINVIRPFYCDVFRV